MKFYQKKDQNMTYAKIISTGSYLPSKILSNHDLEKMVDTSEEWIITRTGIKERRILADNESSCDMAYNAAIDAIKNANISTSEIDVIIVATVSADMIFPSNACLLQNRLGIKNIPAFDINAACSGFLYALEMANAYIKSNIADTILIVGADAVSHYVNYKDRDTCVLFGDGAGAVILKRDNAPGIIITEMHADGSGVEFLHAKAKIKNGEIVGDPYIHMEGRAVFKTAVKSLSDVANSLLTKSSYTKEQITWLIPHQANIRIIEATANHLNLPMDKVIVTLDKHGNTSAASIPLALDYAVKVGKVKTGDLLLLEGFGAGFTWGGCLVKY